MLTNTKLVVGIIVVVLVIYGLFVFDVPYKNTVDDFATCVAAGNPVMESYPRQCKDKGGKTYVETIDVDETTSSDLITIVFPTKDSLITSPLVAQGEARGYWFFEASFPVEIIGEDGTVLTTGIAQAQGEWMTEDFVPFKTSIVFDPKGNTKGIVRFKKDNPSGEAARDASVDVPVVFRLNGDTPQAKTCKPTGCSGQICADEDIVSTCEYKSEYACYKTATCTRQSSGECGWTETKELKACLSNPPVLE